MAAFGAAADRAAGLCPERTHMAPPSRVRAARVAEMIMYLNDSGFITVIPPVTSIYGMYMFAFAALLAKIKLLVKGKDVHLWITYNRRARSRLH
ncbi:hypothetical protein D3C81_1768500 [compost metagenome]